MKFIYILLLLFIFNTPVYSQTCSFNEPFSQYYHNLISAEQYINEKKYEKALNIYQQMLKSKPDSLILNNSIGKLYFLLSNYNKAIKYLKKSITLAKEKKSQNIIGTKYFSSLYYMGLCLEKINKEADALDIYLKICKNYPYGYNYIYKAHMKGYYTQMADKRVKILLEKNYPKELYFSKLPINVARLLPLQEKKKLSDNVLKLCNKLHREYGLFDKALEYFDYALNIDFDNPYLIKEKGLVYQKIGRELDCLKLTLKALQLDPYYYMAMHNIACTYDNLYNPVLSAKYCKMNLEKFKKKIDSGQHQIGNILWEINEDFKMLLRIYIKELRIKESLDLINFAYNLKFENSKFIYTTAQSIFQPLNNSIPEKKELYKLIYTPNDLFYKKIGKNIEYMINMILKFQKSGKQLKIDKWTFNYTADKKNINIKIKILKNKKTIKKHTLHCNEATLYNKLFKYIYNQFDLLKKNKIKNKPFDFEIHKSILEKNITADINNLFQKIRNQLSDLHNGKINEINLFKLSRNLVLYSILINPLDEELSYPYIIRAYSILEILHNKFSESQYIQVYKNICMCYLSRYDLIKKTKIKKIDLNIPNEIHLFQNFIKSDYHKVKNLKLSTSLDYYRNVLLLYFDMLINKTDNLERIKNLEEISKTYYRFRENDKEINNLPFKTGVCIYSDIDSFGHYLNRDGLLEIIYKEFFNIKSILKSCKQNKALKKLKKSDSIFDEEKKEILYFNKSSFTASANLNLSTKERIEFYKNLMDHKNLLKQDYTPFLNKLHKIYKNIKLNNEPWYLNGFTASDYLNLSKKGIYQFLKGVFLFRYDKLGSITSTDQFICNIDELINDVPVLKLCQLIFKDDFQYKNVKNHYIKLLRKNNSFNLMDYYHIFKRINNKKIINRFKKYLPRKIKPYLSNLSKMINLNKVYLDLKYMFRKSAYFNINNELILLGFNANGLHNDAVNYLYNEYNKYPYLSEMTLDYIINHYSKINKPKETKEEFLNKLLLSRGYSSYPWEKLGNFYLSEKLNPEKALFNYRKAFFYHTGNTRIFKKIIYISELLNDKNILDEFGEYLESPAVNDTPGISRCIFANRLGWAYIHKGDIDNGHKYHQMAASCGYVGGLECEALSGLEKNMITKPYENFKKILTRYQVNMYRTRYFEFYLDIGDIEYADLLYNEMKNNCSPFVIKKLNSLFKEHNIKK